MARQENLTAWRRQGQGFLRRSDIAERGAAGRVARAEWKGVQELQKQIAELNKHVRGESRMALVRSVDEAIAPAAEHIRGAIVDRTRTSRWPGSVTAAVFAITDLSKSKGDKRAAVVAVPTGSPRGRHPDVRSASNPKGIYLEWGKRSGKRVGMSLARVFESGTRKFPARPAVRQAIQQAGPRALGILGDGFRGILKDFRIHQVR